MLTATLLVISALAPSAPALPQADAQNDRRTLEQLLAEVRAERDRSLASLLPAVEKVVEELEDLSRIKRNREAPRKRRALMDLGPAVAPLLVQFIDPGESAIEKHRFRAQEVARVLRDIGSPAVVDQLLEKAHAGTRLGRIHALDVLAKSVGDPRVVPSVIGIYEDDKVDEDVRHAALRTLAQLGGPQADTLVTAAIDSSDVDLAGLALEALAAARNEGAADKILEVMLGSRAPKVAPALLQYYRAVPSLITDARHIEGLVRLSMHDTITSKNAVRVLEFLRTSDAKLPTGLKRELEPLREHENIDVREAALLFLARAKDRSARRELMRDYDDRVKQGRNLLAAYEDRADVLYKIADYNSAVKDWKQVLKIQAERRSNTNRAEPFVGISRCLARLDRFKEAADYLSGAPTISMSDLHELAREDDFREMLDSKYREAFHLPDDWSPDGSDD